MDMTAAGESRFHVLAVDDSLLDRKLIERLLKCSSFQVTVVDSGIKALEFLGLNKSTDENNDTDDDDDDDDNDVYDCDDEQQRELEHVSVDSDDQREVSLIITDYCMPEMTGYDLLKKIKESADLRNIPVVIMSSENVPARINRCLEEGADEFFLKPVQLSDMDRLKPHMMKQKNLDENRRSCSETKIMEEMHSPDKPILGFEFDGMKLVAS